MLRPRDLVDALSRDPLADFSLASSDLKSALDAQAATMDDAVSAALDRENLISKMSESVQPALDLGGYEKWQGLHAQEVDQLGSPLREALEAISRQTELVAFKPGYTELAEMAANATSAREELLASPSASYAFAAMATLHNAIEQSPFAEETIAALHSQLGKWHGIDLSAKLFDQQRRQQFYLDSGLDPRLVDLEPQTFDAMLDATELKPNNLPPLLSSHVSADLDEAVEDDEAVEGEEDEELERAGQHYRHLYRFESQLRGFVDRVLSEKAGSGWIKQRVPSDCLAGWRERKTKDRETKKRAHTLLNYADLGDWPKIICRKDNWPYFKPFFNRQVFVEESFNRLIPLRNDIAHMRPLTKADRLVFYAEIQQLTAVIRERPADEDDDLI